MRKLLYLIPIFASGCLSSLEKSDNLIEVEKVIDKFGSTKTSAEVAKVASSYTGVLDFQKTADNFVRLTTIPVMDFDIQQFYDDDGASERAGRRRLPATGRTEEINQSTVLAFIGMAGEFCYEFVKKELNDASGGIIHAPVVDVSSLQSAHFETMAKLYAILFWGREGETDEISEAVEMMEFASNHTDGGTLTNREILFTGCTTIAGSLQGWLH